MGMSRRTEKGQVLILLTVGIITLLGFTALAIDGGRLYSERRNVQGVTDTSSLTGGLYIAQNLKDGINASVLAGAEAAAYQRAENNGYDPSLTSVAITDDPNYYYVKTTIHTTIPPTIVQLVYDGPLSVAATSEARVPKSTIFALGQALVSLGGGDCPHPGISFSGTADFAVHNTGIFSNSNCDPSIVFNGGPAGDIEGNISAVGTVSPPGDVTSLGVVGADPIEFQLIEQPNCGGLDPRTDSGNNLLPGVYANGISIGGNASVTMAPGLYCLDNDFRIQNGTTVGEGVTIYMRNGGVTVNGGTNTLTAPSGNIWHDATPRYWNGMLFFFAYNNNSDLLLNGNGDSSYVGTIFNYNGECTLSGTGDAVAFNAQVVCDKIELSGTAYLDITYNPEEQFLPPTNIDLTE